MNRTRLENQIRQVRNTIPGQVSVLLQELDDENENVLINMDADQETVSASMIKVPILMYLLQRVVDGDFEMTDTLSVKEEDMTGDSMVFDMGERTASIYELAYWMIVYSDNTATNILINFLGMDRLNDYFRKKDLRHTKIERRMLDFEAVKKGRNNYISLEDYRNVVLKFYKEAGRQQKTAETAMSMLLQNRDADALLRYIYEGPSFYHKTGELDDTAHDAGIFIWNHRCWFLGVFISGLNTERMNSDEARKSIGRIGRAVFDAMKREDFVKQERQKCMQW